MNIKKIIKNVYEELYNIDDILHQLQLIVLLLLMSTLIIFAQTIVFDKLYTTQVETLVSFTILIGLLCGFYYVIMNKLEKFVEWSFIIIFAGILFMNNNMVIFALCFLVLGIIISIVRMIKEYGGLECKKKLKR